MLIVADIHGEIERLDRLLAFAESSKMAMVFLGDYINRGTNSRMVIERLIRLKKAEIKPRFLIGNHEVALLRWLDGRLPFEILLSFGANTTISSYTGTDSSSEAEFRRALPRDHLDFLGNLELYLETDAYVISHAGIDPHEPHRRDEKSLVLGQPCLFKNLESLSKLIVCGHYVQWSQTPFFSDKLVCLDTGCGVGGPLTALLWPSLEFFQF